MKHNLLKEILFFLLMIIFSPIIIILCILMVISFILYLPIDLIIYLFKYKKECHYELLITLKRYKENKEKKKNYEEASQA